MQEAATPPQKTIKYTTVLTVSDAIEKLKKAATCPSEYVIILKELVSNGYTLDDGDLVLDAIRNNREEKLSILFKSYSAKITGNGSLLKDTSGRTVFHTDISKSNGVTCILAKYIHKSSPPEELAIIRKQVKENPDYLNTFYKLHGYSKFIGTLRKLYSKLGIVPRFNIRNIDRKYIENTISLVIFLADQNAADLEKLAQFNDCICAERQVLISERDTALGKLAEIKKVLDKVEQ